MQNLSISIIITIIMTFVFNSCAVVLDKYELTSSSIDLTKFDKQGLFVTTGDFSGKYKSKTILIASCYAGYSPKLDFKEKPKKKQYNDNIYYGNSNIADDVKNYNFKSCKTEDLFNEVISQAKNNGANGIIKLEIRNITKPGISGTSFQNGIEIVGLAIKIE